MHNKGRVFHTLHLWAAGDQTDGREDLDVFAKPEPEDPQKARSIRISQPHHRQGFSIGSELDDKALNFIFDSY